MQLLQRRPEHDQRVDISRVTKSPCREHAHRFLPHALAVGRQRSCVIYREQELIVPVPLARCVLLQKIIAVKYFILSLVLFILRDYRPFFVGIG